MKAIFYSVPASGHVNPSLPVVAELTATGDEVLYYATEGHRAAVEHSGARYRRYPDDVVDGYFPAHGLDGTNPPATALALLGTAERVLPRLLAEASAAAPDCVLYDSMCPWGWAVARVLGVPSVASSSLLLLTPSVVLTPAGLRALLPMLVRERSRLRAYRATARRLAARYGIPRLGFLEAFGTPADLVVNYSADWFQPGRRREDRGTCFVGPSLDTRVDTDPALVDALAGPGDRPLVYVSLGTIMSNPGFLRDCVQAFRESPYRVLVALGRHDPATLDGLDGTAADNVVVRASVPQLDVLARAALFVNHAGMNSVQEGLFHGVPLLLAPQQQEQRHIARRVARLGAGLVLDRRAGTSPELIRRTADRLLTDQRYRRTAEELGARLRAAGGQHRAATTIRAHLAAAPPHRP